MINDRKKRMLTCQVWLTTVLVTPTVFRKKECRQHLWDSLHSVYLKNPSTWRQQEVEVDKILRVTGSRGHEIFNIIQTSGSKWKTKEVRAKRMHPYLKNQEVLTGRGKVPNAESTKYRNLDSQPQAIEKPAYGAVTTDVRYWVPRFILSPHLPLASPLQQFYAEPPPTVNISFSFTVTHSAHFCLLEAKWSWLENVLVQNSKNRRKVVPISSWPLLQSHSLCPQCGVLTVKDPVSQVSNNGRQAMLERYKLS